MERTDFANQPDENIAKYIRTCLEMSRYQSEICHNGPDAVQLALEQPFDLILLDVMLPGMDGFQVQERLKARAYRLSF